LPGQLRLVLQALPLELLSLFLLAAPLLLVELARPPLLEDLAREPVVPDLEIAAPLVLRRVQDGRVLERAKHRPKPLRGHDAEELFLCAQGAAPVRGHQVILEQLLRLGAERAGFERRIEVSPQDRLRLARAGRSAAARALLKQS